MSGKEGNIRVAGSIVAIVALFALFAPTAQAVGPPIVSSTSFSTVTDTSATFKAKLDPNGRPTKYHFDYVDQASYIAMGFAGALPAPVPDGAIPVKVEGTGDLTSGSTVVENLTTTNAGAFAPGQTIEGPGIKPGTTIRSVGANSATQQPELTLSQAATETKQGAALSATGPQPVSVQIKGLSPATAYHLRLVAKSNVEVSGEERTLFTLSAPIFGPCGNEAFRSGQFAPSGHPSAALADCRAYEQASPIDKNGGDAVGRVPSVKAAIDGSGITFGSSFGIPGGSGAQALPSYLASRGAGGDWTTQGLLPPAITGEKAKVLGWLPDFSETFANSTVFGSPRANGLLAQSTTGGASTVIVPHVIGAPENFYAGASEDASVVFFESKAQLPPKSGQPPIAAAIDGASNLYAWDRASGELHLASVMNDEKAPPSGAFAGAYDWALGTNAFNLREGGAAIQLYLQEQHAVTATGDVYFTTAGSAQLYLRRNPTEPQSPLNGEGRCTDPALACTIHVSASQKTNGQGEGGADPVGPQPAAFQGASADGSEVFFTSSEKLTNDANTGPEQPAAAIGRGAIAGGIEDAKFIPEHAVGVTVDGSHVYWADPRAGTIGRADLDGNPASVEPAFITPGPVEFKFEVETGPGEFKTETEIVPSSPRYVAVDAGHVYWTNGGRLDEQETPLDGGGTIGRADINGTLASIEPAFIRGASNPQGIAVNATHIYWANAAQGPNTRSIARAEIGGGKVELTFLEQHESTPYGVALSPTHIYFTSNEANNHNSFVNRVSLEGEDREFIFIGKVELRSVAVDATHVYWATQGENAIGRILFADFPPLGGCSGTVGCESDFIKEVKGALNGLAADASHLYWSINGEVPTNPGNDLYRYEAATNTLTDLTADATDTNGAEVQALVGASKDGSYLYFTANGDLDGAGKGAVGNCRGPVGSAKGSCSLYLLHGGAVSFVARLNGDGGIGTTDATNWAPSPREVFGTGSYLPKTSFVSDDGKTLLFRSQEKLADSETEGVPELYRYQADEGPEAIKCVSCPPSGEAPSSRPSLGSVAFPGLGPLSSIMAVSSRNMSADGSRVFFETTEALSPADTNGADGCPRAGSPGQDYPACLDVYEWEAPGSGTCKEAGFPFSPLSGGCVYLISTGKSEFPSLFADASASGEDVFFFTRQQLVGQDEDGLQDVYDARVGGGLPAQNPQSTAPCGAGESCHGPAQEPPAEPTAATPTFVGPADPPPKHKKPGKKKKHKAKKHKAKKHHKRADAKGRTNR
jgi:hypothetical protein